VLRRELKLAVVEQTIEMVARSLQAVETID